MGGIQMVKTKKKIEKIKGRIKRIRKEKPLSHLESSDIDFIYNITKSNRSIYDMNLSSLLRACQILNIKLEDLVSNL